MRSFNTPSAALYWLGLISSNPMLLTGTFAMGWDWYRYGVLSCEIYFCRNLIQGSLAWYLSWCELYSLGSWPHYDSCCSEPSYPSCSPATWLPVPATQGVQLTPGEIPGQGAMDEVPTEVYLPGEHPIPVPVPPHGKCPCKQHWV